MSTPKVSVLVPVYNGAALIARCLESVLAQEGRFLVELLVIDDGSTDDTIAVVQGLRQARLRLLAQENQGPAAARNAGLAQATGSYVAFLDADDYWRPGFLAQTASFLETHPETVAVSVGQLHKFPGKPDGIVPRFLEDYSQPRVPQILDSFFDFWARYNHVCTGSVLMRTDSARQTGGQRTGFRMCEDLEFWAYLATFGPWGFLPEVLFVSDGGFVTHQQGWLTKNRRRWASAPTVTDWEKRIVARLDPRELDGFRRVRMRVAKNLAYAMILSGRDRLARDTLRYVDPQTRDRLGRTLLRASHWGPVAWKALCGCLRLREAARDRRMRVGVR